MWSVFTHVSSSHADLLKQKNVFTIEKNSTPTGLVWYRHSEHDRRLIALTHQHSCFDVT